MVVLALICVISGSVWVNAYTKKAADEAAYEEIREVVHEPVTQTVAATVSLEATTVEATADNKQSSYTAPAGLAELMASNQNVIGWLTINDTKVDYPVCQNKSDNEYFLHRDINGQKNTAGSIYLDSNHDIDAVGLHVIYGHHMKNGSMGSPPHARGLQFSLHARPYRYNLLLVRLSQLNPPDGTFS